MKKYQGMIIRVGLFLMIVLSFYLSYLIWISPVSRDPLLRAEDKAQTTENPQNYKKASEIFQPMRLAKFNDGAIAETRSENLIREVQAIVAAGKYHSLTVTDYPSEKEFVTKTTMKHGLELSFIAPLSLVEYENIFKFDLKVERKSDPTDFNFLSVQLDTDQQMIRFLDTKNFKIAEATMEIDEVLLNETLAAYDKVEWTPMVLEYGLEQKRFYTKEPMKLKTYSYISSTQPYTVFRDAFFTKPQEVRNNDDKSDLVLYDGSESMTIKESEKLIEYRNPNKMNPDKDNLYYQSYSYIRRLGSSFTSLRYFDVVGDMINYRTFVEGYPVFGPDMDAQVSVQIKETNQAEQQDVRISTSLTTIQVPIPSDKTVELPPSQVIVNELLAIGAEAEQLKSAIIGYRWINLQDTGVIDLYPDWYLKYGDEWYAYEELVKHLQKGGGQTNEF